MKLGRPQVAVLGLSLAAALVGVAPHTASAAPGKVDPTPKYADYDTSGKVTTAVSGADQCDLPVPNRVGNWVCVEQPNPPAPNARSKRAARKALVASEVGFCLTDGCWYYTDDFHAHDSSTGYFGYGGNQLGRVQMTDRHSLNGAQMLSDPQFSSSTAVVSLHAHGDLLVGSHTGPGTVLSGASSDTDHAKSSLAGGSWWRPWGTTKFKTYDKAHLNHANVVEFAWDKAGYPGYWYLYQKSIIADDPNNNNVYGFNFSEEMFTSSAAAGYHSS